MTPEFIERVQRDYNKETNTLDWESYIAGYWAGVNRFGEKRESCKSTNSKLRYSRIGLKNV